MALIFAAFESNDSCRRRNWWGDVSQMMPRELWRSLRVDRGRRKWSLVTTRAGRRLMTLDREWRWMRKEIRAQDFINRVKSKYRRNAYVLLKILWKTRKSLPCSLRNKLQPLACVLISPQFHPLEQVNMTRTQKLVLPLEGNFHFCLVRNLAPR